jgi:hypothetical protein
MLYQRLGLCQFLPLLCYPTIITLKHRLKPILVYEGNLNGVFRQDFTGVILHQGCRELGGIVWQIARPVVV